MKQKAIALTQLEEAKQRAKYMEEKANHYLDIINGVVPDDTNPKEWESINSNTPQKKEQADFLLENWLVLKHWKLITS